MFHMPIQVAARSNLWVCGRLLAAGSNPAGKAWMFVSCECSVLSGSLGDEMITRREESHRLWFADVCDLDSSSKRRP